MTTLCSGQARNPDRTTRPCRNWAMHGQATCMAHGGLRAVVAEEIAAAIEKWRDECHGTEWTAAHACHNGDALIARQVGGVSTTSGLGPMEDES